jgi:cell division protein FtsL
MTRLNLVLLIAVLFTAMYLVNVQYESRRLTSDLERAALEARKLDAERERLELEKQEQVTLRHVEKQAREKLQMRPITPSVTHYIAASSAAKMPAQSSDKPPVVRVSP